MKIVQCVGKATVSCRIYFAGFSVCLGGCFFREYLSKSYCFQMNLQEKDLYDFLLIVLAVP